MCLQHKHTGLTTLTCKRPEQGVTLVPFILLLSKVVCCNLESGVKNLAWNKPKSHVTAIIPQRAQSNLYALPLDSIGDNNCKAMRRLYNLITVFLRSSRVPEEIKVAVHLLYHTARFIVSNIHLSCLL